MIAESFHSMVTLTWDIEPYQPGLAIARFQIAEVQVEVRFEVRNSEWTVSFDVLHGSVKDFV